MPSEHEIIAAMASGSRIVVIAGRGYDCDEYELQSPSQSLSQIDIVRLLDKGWIYSSNTAYFLTDEGKKAYLRSIDELGTGELIAPTPAPAQSPSAQPEDK